MVQYKGDMAAKSQNCFLLINSKRNYTCSSNQRTIMCYQRRNKIARWTYSGDMEWNHLLYGPIPRRYGGDLTKLLRVHQFGAKTIVIQMVETDWSVDWQWGDGVDPALRIFTGRDGGKNTNCLSVHPFSGKLHLWKTPTTMLEMQMDEYYDWSVALLWRAGMESALTIFTAELWWQEHHFASRSSILRQTAPIEARNNYVIRDSDGW